MTRLLCVVVAVLTGGCVADVETDGAGGALMSDVPEPGEEQVEGSFVNCKNATPAECMRKCLRRAIPCTPHRAHPYSPSSGVGDLFTCGERPVLICAYRYRNKDQCYWFPGSDRPPKCMYSGG